MSFIFTDIDDSAPLHVSAGCGNLESMNVLSKRCLFKNAKKIYYHSIYGGCTKWQNEIIHYLSVIAAKLKLMQFISSQICKQHTYM